MVQVQTVIGGPLLASRLELAPSISQSIDPNGVCLISISALNGKMPLSGSGVVVFIEVQAVGAGDATLTFDKNMIHLVATDARDVVLDLKQGSASVRR